MYQNLRTNQPFFVCLEYRSQLQCGYNTVDLCKDYAVDNVKCKNLKYKTDEPPEWDCDFKFKLSNITAYRYEVKYESHTFTNKGKANVYCYKKDTPFLDYILDYVPNKPEPTGFNWTWIIVVGSILAIVGILVVLVMFTEKGRNTFNSFKSG